MAMQDPLTAADLGSGVAVARARGATAARSATESGQRTGAAFQKFIQDLERARKSAVSGDIAMLASVVAPFALPALGKALGKGATSPVATQNMDAEGRVGGASVVSADAQEAGELPGVVPPPPMPPPATPAPGPTFRQRVASGLQSFERLQPYAGPLAQTIGGLAGTPSPEVRGATSLINSIGKRRRFDRRVGEFERLTSMTPEDVEELDRLQGAGYGR